MRKEIVALYHDGQLLAIKQWGNWYVPTDISPELLVKVWKYLQGEVVILSPRRIVDSAARLLGIVVTCPDDLLDLEADYLCEVTPGCIRRRKDYAEIPKQRTVCRLTG